MDVNEKKLAILVPYRDRKEHFEIFLKETLPFIKNQVSNAKLFLLEQEEGMPFNKGMIFNSAVKSLSEEFDYFCLHDIDMVPTEVDYSFAENATHLATITTQFGNKLPYYEYFGGVVLIPSKMYVEVNGFSNGYWGWGGEDDDFLYRIKHKGLRWTRRECKFQALPQSTNEFDTNGIPYETTIQNRKRFAKQKIKKQYHLDGYSNVDFSIVQEEEKSLYKHFVFSFNGASSV